MNLGIEIENRKKKTKEKEKPLSRSNLITLGPFFPLVQPISLMPTRVLPKREIGLHLFLYEFWWLNCPTQINWTN
jgi:hypothetical protein